VRRPTTLRSPRLLAGVVALVLVVAAVVAVLALRGDDSPGGGAAGSGDAAPQVTTLDQLASSDPVVARGSFCDRVPDGAVVAALGGEPTASSDYANGDRAPLTEQTTDVAHEYGCSWTSGTGATARAWVFAPPVTRGRAAALVRRGPGRGCTAGTPASYGDPTLASTCTSRTSGQVTTTRAGLFGDAWLTCALTGPADAAAAPAPSPSTQPADPQDRLDAWCVQVALAAAPDTSE